MEAVPRLPMTSFQLRTSPEPTDFAPKLKQYIRDFYKEDPESYANEIHQFENLRAMATRPSIAVTGCSLLQKYYCQLHFLESRFPMGTDQVAAVTFTWIDAYTNVVLSLANIRFEILSILYNIGAVHTQLGAKTERTSAEGMKMACAHFQCAAWAFEHVHMQSNFLELEPFQLMNFMQQLCLAQAQECILEKSMLDNRKPTIVAKVAKQIVDYYAQALATLEPNSSDANPISEHVGSKIYKNWKRYVKFKRAYHLAVTQLYQGLAAEEQQKMGERVAFYNASLTSLNDAKSIYTNAKGAVGITGVASEKEAIEDALTFTNDVIEGKRKAAKNENEFIYHEEVPEKDVLPTVNGASLVKGIPFSVNDPEVSGPDIFAKLVPVKVHVASSLYSEEKAKILRSVGADIEESDQQLETYLASLKLQHLSLWDPDSQSGESDILRLPDELAERCAALNARPNAIEDLVDIMGKLSDTYRDVESMLKEIDALLTEEGQREKRYQEAMGKRPPTIVATDLTRETKKYEEAHAKASESNQALHRAITMHVNNLQVLAQPLAALMATIPSPTSNSSGQKSDSEADKSHAREVKRLLGKVDEMQRQRNELHGKLRESIAQDDLTRLIVITMAESGSLDTLFAEQLEKHQPLVNLIYQNLSAQDNILAALTDAYAQTADARKNIEEILKRRELTVNSLITSYDAYEDLLAKSTKGLEFYRKLEVNVTKLLQRVKSTCRVQEEEREQILARNEKGNHGNPGDTSSVAAPSAERKTGSGMKLRDHLAARLKNKNATNYQQTHYGSEKNYAPNVQPNAAVGAKVYSVDPSASESVNPSPSGREMQVSNQQIYQGYYPNDYTNYYVPQAQAQYNPSQYSEFADESNAPSSVQSFPRTGTTNTESMYRLANRNSDGSTQVSSNSTVYAGYNNAPNNDNVSVSPIVAQHAQYPVAGQVLYETTDYSQFSAEYKMPDNRGYPTGATVQPVSTGYHSVPSPHPTPYNASNIPASSGVATNQSPSHVPVQQNVLPAGNQHPVPPQQNYDSGQTYAYQMLPQQQISQNPEASITQYPSNSVNLQNQQYSAALPTSNPSYAIAEPYGQQNAATSDASAAISGGIYSSSVSTVDRASPKFYYTNSTEASNVMPQYKVGYAGNQQNYPAADMQNSQAQATQSPQNYSNYGNYQGESGVNQYPASSSIPTQIGNTPSYANGTELIQSHTKFANNTAYLPGYQYPLQAHNATTIQYPNYSQGYGDTAQGYASQASSGTPGLTDSYRGHPGYAYDPNLGMFSYSSGYQESQNTSATGMNDSFVLPQNGQLNYPQQDANSRYTSANNGVTTNLTPSSQYPLNSSYQSPTSEQHDYNQTLGANHPQNPEPTVPNVAPSVNTDQTYHAPSPVVQETATPQPEIPEKPTEKKSEAFKSNLDLLAELDITINHAPLVPEVHSIENKSKDVSATVTKLDETKEKPNNTVDTVHQFDDKHENLQIVWDTWYTDVQPKRDPLGDPVALQKFATDVEKYEKFVDSLTVKTLSGSTNLAIKWNEITDIENREMEKQTCYVAQAHSSANRTTNLVPYDSTRVKLASADMKSDYINASHVNDLTQWTPAAFIVAQAPKPESFEAFWTMFWEQGSEVIACLCSNQQLNDEIYWPTNKDNNLTIGKFTLCLKNSTNHTAYVQRVISIRNSEQSIERVAVHMQYLAWPSTGLPSSPGSLLAFATDILSEQALRHCSPKPIVIHCFTGGSLSGLFLLAAAAVCHVRAGHGAVDVPLVFSTLVKYRRCMIDKESLLFGYRMVLYHAQDTLMKRGILSTRSTFDCFENRKGKKGMAVKKPQHCHPSDDFLHNLGVGIQHGIARQQGEQPIGQASSQTKTVPVPQEKTDKVDPLSQLDPLWSIRR